MAGLGVDTLSPHSMAGGISVLFKRDFGNVLTHGNMMLIAGNADGENELRRLVSVGDWLAVSHYEIGS
jgi:hypothetical protein